MKSPLEPTRVSATSENYSSDLAFAFAWYNHEKEKKDARAYLRTFVGKEKAKIIDKVPDSQIITTYGWLARMLTNGCTLREKEALKLNDYINNLYAYKVELKEEEPSQEPQVPRLTVKDYVEDKAKEYIGELEGVLDNITSGEETNFDLYKDMQARHIPGQYCQFIEPWVKKKAGEFIGVYETTDKDVKEAYGHITKRKLTAIIKMFSSWIQDIERYTQFKKANRKPRAKKIKPASVQVAKLKYKKEFPELNLKSVNPVEVIGASQVWVYNTKYKKLAVYRSDNRDGIQVKGTALQNYEPDQCEQKTLRKPADVLKKVLEGGKIVLRKLLTDLPAKASPVNGRLNEECIILRAIK